METPGFSIRFPVLCQAATRPSEATHNAVCSLHSLVVCLPLCDSATRSLDVRHQSNFGDTRLPLSPTRDAFWISWLAGLLPSSSSDVAAHLPRSTLTRPRYMAVHRETPNASDVHALKGRRGQPAAAPQPKSPTHTASAQKSPPTSSSQDQSGQCASPACHVTRGKWAVTRPRQGHDRAINSSPWCTPDELLVVIVSHATLPLAQVDVYAYEHSMDERP